MPTGSRSDRCSGSCKHEPHQEGVLMAESLESQDIHVHLPSAPLRLTSPGLLPFLDISPDALIIVNAVGTIVIANGQTEVVFGYAREELLGQPLEMLLPQRFRET